VQTASLGRRLGALFIDWIIAGLSAVAVAGVSYPPKNLTENFIITGFFVGEVSLLTGLLGYSIGKRILGLKVENRDGRPIGILRALVRTALLCLAIPALVMTEDRRGLHDLAAGSRVIRA
jgi:uncharacterized RDD family membrane protein YckC